MTPHLVLLLATFTLLEPSVPASPEGAAPAAQSTTRPTHDRDPWVFRCVLDDNPRMLIVSLGDQWWMAFDTVHCSIYRVWQGDIELTGAVYDTKHGPQPKAKGRFIIDQPLTWQVRRKEQDHPPGWSGYSIRDDVVTLTWQQGPVKFALTPRLTADEVVAEVVTQSGEADVSVRALLGLSSASHVAVHVAGTAVETGAGGGVAIPASGTTRLGIDKREKEGQPTKEMPK